MHGTFKRQVPSAMEYRHTAVSFGVDDWSQGVSYGCPSKHQPGLETLCCGVAAVGWAAGHRRRSQQRCSAPFAQVTDAAAVQRVKAKLAQLDGTME